MSGRETTSAAIIRVEKGAPDALELAALTAVLLGRRAAPRKSADRERTLVPWRRTENPAAPPTPRSWRS
ncbi:acyl-CoA carboxylase subunit epsilon [Streptomyces griseoluteus]|uniref:Acyl-CoA carboxylase subunit epsilon n=1 Tax=Streptomyces griseoluteus TaxID=29306 RepID=A0A4Z1DJ10_STRGP|nr:acyl-CoA carboxylase subunit epsilon [Streptomyces griseoluteus]TGN82347.1 acyl-CoA carboxylase subunit epsilon [Streptomyces griseoluteus]GHF10179.1 hypothetical protein GCM10017776_29880 [Streptomyces griseoluteus]